MLQPPRSARIVLGNGGFQTAPPQPRCHDLPCHSFERSLASSHGSGLPHRTPAVRCPRVDRAIWLDVASSACSC